VVVVVEFVAGYELVVPQQVEAALEVGLAEAYIVVVKEEKAEGVWVDVPPRSTWQGRLETSMAFPSSSQYSSLPYLELRRRP
jgi:hypothetical protein